MSAPTYMTLEEAARELRVHPQTLRRWIRAGQFPAHRFGKQYRVTPEDLARAARVTPSAPLREGDQELAGFDRTSLAALEEVWDNEADAVYDNWRELYGVPER
jgi:excisionase family DNA binding protein